MRHIIFLFLLLCIPTLKSRAQSEGTKFAIVYSAKKSGLTNMTVKNKRHICEQRVVEPKKELNLMTVITKIGIDKNTAGRMSQRDTLFKLYPVNPPNRSFFEYNIIFDSIQNCLTVSTDNTMYSSTTSYTFDSIGRLVSTLSSFATEVLASSGETKTTYKYVPEQNTIIATVSFNKNGSTLFEPQSITQTLWDVTQQFPIEEIVTDLRSKKTTSYTFSYKKNRLHKIRIIERENNKIIKTNTYRYYFGERLN